VTLEFLVVGPEHEDVLADLFTDVDETFFRPHPFTWTTAHDLANAGGRDVYAVLLEDGRPVAYGMLRGWDEGYRVPSLGIAVRTSAAGRGLGGVMMGHLHAEAARRGATVVRLRVHPANVRARRLYERLGYAYVGEERGELLMLLDVAGPPPARQAPLAGARLEGSLLDPEAPLWQAVLDSSPHDFYHLPGYVALSGTHEGGRPCALHVTDGHRTLLLPILVRRIPGGGFDAASPYGYPGPIGAGTDEPAFLRLAFAAAGEVLRRERVVSAFIRFHPLLNPDAPRGIGTLVVHGDTVSVDLALPADVLWAQTRTNHRRDITRARRLGYRARMDAAWEHLAAFKALYRQTMRRRSASPFYFFDDAYFEGLRDVLGERLHLCVVERGGDVAAAGLFVETDGIVQYHLSGTDEAHQDRQPTKLMMSYVASWAKARGDRVLHLGGGVGGADDPLLRFKVGFSPRRHSFVTGRLVLDERRYSELVRSRDPELDPGTRSGYFPLYRRPEAIGH